MNINQKIASCSTVYNHKRKTLKDPEARSNSIYAIENENENNYSIIQIDSCVFDSNFEKCDFGLALEDKKMIHFIELKGKDNNKGFRQLYSTLTTTIEIYRNYKKKVRLIVSESEAPRFLDQNTILKIGILVGDTLNGKKGNFIRANNKFTEIIS